jgi:hypothetical protein
MRSFSRAPETSAPLIGLILGYTAVAVFNQVKRKSRCGRYYIDKRGPHFGDRRCDLPTLIFELFDSSNLASIDFRYC